MEPEQMSTGTNVTEEAEGSRGTGTRYTLAGGDAAAEEME